MAAAFTGALLGAGFDLGAPAPHVARPRLVHGAGFLLCALLLYPVLRALSEGRGTAVTPFAKWAAVWAAAAVAGYGLAYPLVWRAIDRLF